jgi:hypothetical protein
VVKEFTSKATKSHEEIKLIFPEDNGFLIFFTGLFFGAENLATFALRIQAVMRST